MCILAKPFRIQYIAYLFNMLLERKNAINCSNCVDFYVDVKYTVCLLMIKSDFLEFFAVIY